MKHNLIYFVIIFLLSLLIQSCSYPVARAYERRTYPVYYRERPVIIHHRPSLPRIRTNRPSRYYRIK